MAKRKPKVMARETRLTSQFTTDHLYAQQLAEVVATICSSERKFDSFDELIQAPVLQCLTRIGAIGLITHFPHERLTLSRFRPEFQESRRKCEEILGKKVREQEKVLEEKLKRDDDLVIPPFDEGGFVFIVVLFPPVPSDSSRPLRLMNSAALVYQRNAIFAVKRELPDQQRLEEDYHINLHGRSSLRLLFHVLRGRVRLFAPFAGRCSQRYWDDAVPDRSEVDRVRPPWYTQGSVRTATLSFDLRKSTFCMENSENPAKFAEWLDQLVQILSRVTHLHGGVFDKFTGDGALVHFLQKECREVYDSEKIRGEEQVSAYLLAAVACAVDMQGFIARHLERLRPWLRRDSRLLGGAIGIDVADAHWSIDHRGNPIVVGRGVVEACRLGDGTRAGKIRLGNTAYHELPSNLRTSLRRVLFRSKEFDEKMKLRAWEFMKLPYGLHSRLEKVYSICEEVYEDFRRRKEV